jgi:hypothetical protein
MHRITIRRALTWHYRKMHPCVEQSDGLVPLSLFPSWQGCITNTSGYDFRKGQDPKWSENRRVHETFSLVKSVSEPSGNADTLAMLTYVLAKLIAMAQIRLSAFEAVRLLNH